MGMFTASLSPILDCVREREEEEEEQQQQQINDKKQQQQQRHREMKEEKLIGRVGYKEGDQLIVILITC